MSYDMKINSMTKTKSRTQTAGQLRFCWKSPVPPKRLTVASAAAPKTANADLRCDGTADETVINAALAALPEGGEVVLLAGEYRLDSRIVLRRRGLTLRGEAGSILVREFYDYPAEQGMVALLSEGCSVRGLRLEGLWQGRTTGFEGTQCALAVHAGGAEIEGVEIRSVCSVGSGTAVGIEVLADSCRIANTKVNGCFAPCGDAYGIRIRGRDCRLSGNVVSGNYAAGRCRGIDVDGAGARLCGNQSCLNVSAQGQGADVFAACSGWAAER